MITRRGFFGLFAGAAAIPEVESVRQLVMKPDDVLVVSLQGHPSPEQMARTKELIESRFPHIKVLVHTKDVELSVWRKES